MASEFDGLPVGAEWHRCALQVNPFRYLEANGKSLTEYGDEDSYNKALVEAFVDAGISVIAITDHWCVDSGTALRVAAEAAGLTVFPGFEATTKDGVHLLVVFDPATDIANINRHIGECGIPADCQESRPGSLDTVELLESAEQWGAVTVAPHVTTGGGLLDKLSGQSAVHAWTDVRLHAVALGGAKPSQGKAAILANKEGPYRRSNPLAVLGAADISSPADAAKAGSSCWIKLSSLTISGLDLAFRTPETRVTRTDPTDCAHPRIIGICWEGGFLDGVSTVSFDPNLPMVSLDLSRIQGSDQLIAMVMACASAWMEAALCDPEGGQRWVIYDEAWRLLRQPALLARMQSQWKLSRGLGIANLMIVHRLSDLDAVGSADSEARALALGLLADCSTKIIYQQESSEAPHTADVLGLSVTERAQLPDLQRGEGLWRVGQRAFVVRHLVTDGELALFDTNSRMTVAS